MKRILLLVIALMMITVSAFADKQEWIDKDYDFGKAKRILVNLTVPDELKNGITEKETEEIFLEVLQDKVTIITGGDSGIGRAVAVAFAKEGAKLMIVYYDEHQDAFDTKEYIKNLGGNVELLAGDLKDPSFAKFVVDSTLEKYGKIDILVNNAGVQYPQKSLLDITEEQFDFTLKTNLYSMFYLTKEVLPYLKEGSSIINTSSITTYYGEAELIDYAASKGAIVGFTKSLATNLASKNIRVNAVAPGTFWTPLQPSSWPSDKIPMFGSNSDLKRAGEPYEIASTYVYLASPDASYTTGQVLHVNGGEYKA